MTGRELALRTASPADRSTVERLLDANDLPTADLDHSPATFFLAYDQQAGVADSAETATPVGVAGLERYDDVALLRSVVVPESRRGTGYGRALCAAIESRAATDGVQQLYLLTETASEFFEDQGWDRIDRRTVPDAIQETSEFTTLCPSSATCMQKHLSDTA